MSADRDITLMGLRGSGKTTLGMLLAERLGLGFVDLDDLTPCELGAETCAEALHTHGEPAFREAERATLDRVLDGSGPRVIALGGGTPAAPGVAQLLRDRDVLRIYLACGTEALRDRLSGTDLSTRPALTDAGTLDEIAELHGARDPLYRHLASAIVNGDGPIEDVIERLVTIVRETGID